MFCIFCFIIISRTRVSRTRPGARLPRVVSGRSLAFSQVQDAPELRIHIWQVLVQRICILNPLFESMPWYLPLQTRHGEERLTQETCAHLDNTCLLLSMKVVYEVISF